MAPTRESWMGKISKILSRPDVDEGIWEDIEELLMSSDLGSVLTNILIDRVKIQCTQLDKLQASVVFDVLKQEIIEMIGPGRDILPGNSDSNPKGPLVILVVGVNGVGKTTSVAKMAQYFKDADKTVIIAASDTYRAAAIEQILSWGNKIDVDVISHVDGGDPAAVAFDAVEAGKARGVDIVLVDTAGRLHTKSNLMDEIRRTYQSPTMAPHCSDVEKYKIVDDVVQKFKEFFKNKTKIAGKLISEILTINGIRFIHDLMNFIECFIF